MESISVAFDGGIAVAAGVKGYCKGQQETKQKLITRTTLSEYADLTVCADLSPIATGILIAARTWHEAGHVRGLTCLLDESGVVRVEQERNRHRARLTGSAVGVVAGASSGISWLSRLDHASKLASAAT